MRGGRQQQQAPAPLARRAGRATAFAYHFFFFFIGSSFGRGKLPTALAASSSYMPLVQYYAHHQYYA